METKPELRKRFMALRDAQPPADREAWSLAVCDHVERFCLSRRIHRLAVFWPLGSELDLRPLITRRKDWLFSFPRVSSTSPPRLAWGSEPLQPGLWGLMEPMITQHFLPPVQLVLTPGLVFDDRGFRIGYGKGFYDAMLDRLSPEVLTLGVCFHMQRVPGLPESPADHPVMGVITERGLEWFRKPGDDA